MKNVKNENVIVRFADWYFENRSVYLDDYFKNDRDIFISALSNYAVEFAKAHGYNPFLIEKGNITFSMSKLRTDLYQPDQPKNSFVSYSKRFSNHVPRAILGNENYLVFLSELNDEKQKYVPSKVNKPKKQTTIAYFYEQEELRDNFFLRLITQNRFYKTLNYPVSVLKKLFYKNGRKDFFDKWVNEQIDNIAVYISKTEKIPFKEVVSLEITDDNSVLLNGKYNLFTAVAGSETKKEITTNLLKNIDIDHVIPFVDIFSELKPQLPALQAIHNTLENNNKGRITNKKDLSKAGNYLLVNAEELDALEKDLELISSKVQLQLMDKYENLSKKKFS